MHAHRNPLSFIALMVTLMLPWGGGGGGVEWGGAAIALAHILDAQILNMRKASKPRTCKATYKLVVSTNVVNLHAMKTTVSFDRMF